MRFSNRYWSPLDRHTVRDRVAWHFGRSHRCSSENPLQNSDRRSSCRSAKDVVGKRRDFQKRIDCRKKSDEKDRESLNELNGRDSALGLKIKDSQDEVRNNVNNRRCDYLVEGVLDEAFEPAPKEPFQFRNYKERYEYRSHEYTHRRRDESESDHDDCDGLGRREQNNDDDINYCPKDVRDPWRVHTGLVIGDSLFDSLQFGLVDFIREKLGLVCD